MNYNSKKKQKVVFKNSKKKLYIIEVFDSNLCKILFLISLILGYFLIPKDIFLGRNIFLGLIFLINFAAIISCIVRNIKERVLLAKTYNNSILGILASAIGLAALQVCGVNSAVCGAGFGFVILSAIFPNFIIGFLDRYAIALIILSILIQWISLYFMGCFKKILDIKVKR